MTDMSWFILLILWNYGLIFLSTFNQNNCQNCKSWYAIRLSHSFNLIQVFVAFFEFLLFVCCSMGVCRLVVLLMWTCEPRFIKFLQNLFSHFFGKLCQLLVWRWFWAKVERSISAYWTTRTRSFWLFVWHQHHGRGQRFFSNTAETAKTAENRAKTRQNSKNEKKTASWAITKTGENRRIRNSIRNMLLHCFKKNGFRGLFRVGFKKNRLRRNFVWNELCCCWLSIFLNFQVFDIRLLACLFL